MKKLGLAILLALTLSGCAALGPAAVGGIVGGATAIIATHPGWCHHWGHGRQIWYHCR